MKIVNRSLFTRRTLVADPNYQYLQNNLEKEPACISIVFYPKMHYKAINCLNLDVIQCKDG